MKRIGLIALALVLALGLMGAGLAYWNETLTIEGTVNTGIFDMEFTDVDSSDKGVDPGGDGSLNVASCEATPSGPDDPNDPTNLGSNKITVVIDNAYPCYNPVVSFTVHNRGSIPAKIVSVTISDDCSAFIGDITNSGDTIDVNLGNATTSPDGLYDLHIVYSGVSEGDVLAAGASVVGSLNIHVWESGVEGSDATENADGSFTITIDTIQFNAP